MTTIKDIAEKLGLSVSTVSRALNHNDLVNIETRNRVLEAAKEMNYYPNFLARGLTKGKTNTIALIIPNISNPIFPSIIRGVEGIASLYDYRVILCDTNEDVTLEVEYVDKLLSQWVEGFIFTTAKSYFTHFSTLKEKHIPMVHIARCLDNCCHKVIIDNVGAAYRAVNYLIDQGHQSIAIFNGDLQISVYADRFEGYKLALKKAGIQFKQELIFQIDDIEIPTVYDYAISVFENNKLPDAIFSTSDPKTLGIYKALNNLGFRIPDDVSIISIDNLNFSAFLNPPLTTIRQPFYEMGQEGAKLLFKLLDQKDEYQENPIEIILDTELIIRNSVKDKRSD